MHGIRLRLGDPSVVRLVHVVGHRRWPGLLPLPRSPRIGQLRMSLWSALVVSIRDISSGEHRSVEIYRTTGYLGSYR